LPSLFAFPPLLFKIPERKAWMPDQVRHDGFWDGGVRPAVGLFFGLFWIAAAACAASQ
jgi:hypothetical protein